MASLSRDAIEAMRSSLKSNRDSMAKNMKVLEQIKWAKRATLVGEFHSEGGIFVWPSKHSESEFSSQESWWIRIDADRFGLTSNWVVIGFH